MYTVPLTLPWLSRHCHATEAVVETKASITAKRHSADFILPCFLVAWTTATAAPEEQEDEQRMDRGQEPRELTQSQGKRDD